MGSVARYDSNGNNTNTPSGRNNPNSPNSGNNVGPANNGNNTSSSSSNTNNRDVNTSSNTNTRNITRNINTNDCIIIVFTLLVIICIALFLFSSFQVTLINYYNFWIFSPFDFTYLSSLSL